MYSIARLRNSPCISDLKFSSSHPHLLASASYDRTVRLWNPVLPAGSDRIALEGGKNSSDRNDRMGLKKQLHRRLVRGELVGLLSDEGHSGEVLSIVSGQLEATSRVVGLISGFLNRTFIPYYLYFFPPVPMVQSKSLPFHLRSVVLHSLPSYLLLLPRHLPPRLFSHQPQHVKYTPSSVPLPYTTEVGPIKSCGHREKTAPSFRKLPRTLGILIPIWSSMARRSEYGKRTCSTSFLSIAISVRKDLFKLGWTGERKHEKEERSSTWALLT